MTKLKPLYLSLSKWRCGGHSSNQSNKMGCGVTSLKNKDGFMCCLGQWVEQRHPGVDIIGYALPIKKLKDELFLTPNSGYNFYTYFTSDAANINDDEQTSIHEKVISLEILAQTEGYRLVVVD